MLIAQGWRGSAGVTQGIWTALTLSGLFDLQPLRLTSVNSWLSLSEEDAIRNSPILNIPGHSNTHLIASVGGRRKPPNLDVKRRTMQRLGKQAAKPVTSSRCQTTIILTSR